MKTNLTLRILSTLLTLCALLFSVEVFAQPPNDECVDAIEFSIAADEASCVEVSGDTNGGTGSTAPSSVCSGSWFGDDIWFKFTTPATLPNGALIVKSNFGTEAGDVLSVGMAIYESCDASAEPLTCFSSADAAENQSLIFSGNLMPDQTYYVRIWSGGSPNDNSGTLRVCGFWGETDDDVVLWDGGQFDGGLNGWTTVGISSDTAVWTYKDCACSAGFWRQSVISSPTAFNGAVVFDADLLNFDVTAQPYPVHRGELISPVIDCSTFEAVSLKYYQSYDALNGTTAWAYSLDNGTTWSEEFEVNEEIEGNEGTPQPSVKRHFISEAAGVDSFRVKFIFDADYYNWILDDIQLIQPERNNLVVMDNFYAIAPNAITPISQVEPFSFLADVYNAGSATQTNVVLDVDIDDGTDVWNASLIYGSIEGDSLAENVPFAEFFTPDGDEVKMYDGMYEVTSDSVDFDDSDNIRRFTFETSDTVFAKENGATGSIRPADNNWDDGEAHSWAYGNHYYIADGDNWNVSSATFSIGAPDVSIVGRLLEISLYKWDEDANSVADNNMDPDERTKVGTYTYEITGEETIDDLITVPLNIPPNLPGPIDVESGGHYVIMVEYNTNDINDFFMATNDERNYGAMVFRSEEEEGIAGPTSRYAGMLGINEPLSDEPYSSVGFGRDVVPVVRLNVSLVTSTEVALDPANKIEITPNPANNVINLNLDLVENQERVNVRILDVNGRLVMDQPYLNLQTETLQFDVSGYPAGAYFLHFITETGVRTERFIVQH